MRRIVGLVALVVAGAAASAVLTISPASADPWNIDALPNGYAVLSETGRTDCPSAPYYTVNGTVIGCSSDVSFQSTLDAYIDSTICTVNPGADPALCAPTTTTATTTVAVPTTTAAAPVIPPATTTITQTVTDTTGATTTVAVTTTVSVVEQSLQDQINALAAQIAALTDRVTRLEKAGDASWLAFEQAIAGGATVADAAAQARGTWLNVVNQLGAFAAA